MAAWTHTEKRRVQTKRGWDVTYEFERNTTGDVKTCTFHFDSEAQITSQSLARMTQKKNRYELRWSDLNRFDLGEDSKQILIKLITAIRVNNDLTITQILTWYDTNYPDALCRGEQLISKMRNFLTKELGFTPTWDQFKNYVIANIFEGVD